MRAAARAWWRSRNPTNRASRTLERASPLASARMHPIMCVRSHIVFRNPTGKSDHRGSANLVGSAKSALCVYAVVEGPCGTLHSSRRRPRTRRGARRAQDFFGPRQGLRRRHVQSIHVEAARDGRISRVIDEASRRRWRGGELLCLDKAWYGATPMCTRRACHFICSETTAETAARKPRLEAKRSSSSRASSARSLVASMMV